MPVPAIATMAHARGAALVVDGSRAAGAIAVDTSTTGADIYAVAGRTWLLGPDGIAALWISPSALGGLRSAAAHDVATVDETARRFDARSFHGPSVVGLGRSVGWLSMTVGLPTAHARGIALAAAAAARLSRVEGASIVTPLDRMATILTFRIAGWPAQAALDELGARVFAIGRVVPRLDAIRISIGWFNDAAELERFASTVELLASHTPETLPRRPHLEILGGGS